MIAELLLYLLPAPLTQHHYDVLVFYYTVQLLLHGHNPYNVPSNAPWIYSNPVPYPQWFAYPPFSLLVWSALSLPLYILHILNIFTFRIVDKIVVVGSVFWIAKRAEELRKGSYKFIVFNPLFWFTTAIHGMPDSLATALFVEALYRLYKKEKNYWVFYSLSLVTKQITWLTLPAFVGYWLKERRLKEMILVTLLSIAIVLPFFGKPFIEDVLAFHGERPPASLGYTGVPLIAVAGDASTFHIANLVAPCFGKPMPKVGIGSYVLSAAFLGILIWSFFKSIRGNFIGSMALASLGFILFSKVVSPQNLLLPFVVFLFAGAPYKWLLLPSIFAMIVDLSMGTAYGPLGYLAEDVLNALGTSIVHIYRSLGSLRPLLNAPGLPALLAYHVTVVILIYFLVKNRLDIKKFLFLYLVYLVLVSTSVTQTQSTLHKVVEFKHLKVAVIWPWLNPYSGIKAGDFLWMKVDPKIYWEYTYPLALGEVRWLKTHGFNVVGLVYSPDREDLYEYVPWLFAISEEKMGFVWVLAVPKSYKDYINGWASYPPSTNLTRLLKKIYRLTPLYINSKINMVNRLLNNTITLGVCPLPYPQREGKALVFVIGNIPNVSYKDVILEELPNNATIINDFYKGHVYWGTPITPTKPEELPWGR
ncbi:hypothetical protein IPA_00645 [Ignicoccus pacificus DSM 13166]|uniref:Uncharacterized protein n=1 Tax=Ignicoccus pacificus DSM 13166 TaxID=940294 RepID=A0A977PKG5_9CREN|nr:hypothetical protein IPA_00645 [Ignicoccus pacificus DSM 13166]